MTRFLFIPALTLLAFASAAQENTFTKASDADPAAKAVLDAVKAKYESYRSLEVQFSLLIEIPEEPEEVQKGTLLQEGEKYRLKLEGQTVVSDGTTLWLYLENNKEVQINNVEDEDEETILSPKDLLRVYESEDYVYALTNELVENGRVVQQIEFKPLDDDSEYSKIRLTVDKKTRELRRIKVFAKDGSRYTLAVEKLIPNKKFPPETFVFQKSECPDCHWEDLRID